MPGHHSVDAILVGSKDPVRAARILKMRNACRIGQEFYRIRKLKRVSQKHLAELLRCSVDSVSRTEEGDYTYLEDSFLLLKEAAHILGVEFHVDLLPEGK